MAIRTLSLQEFDRFRSARTTMARRLTERAVEWFAHDTGSVLGALTYDERDLDWSFVILGRNTDGKFCAVDRHIGVEALEDARRLLVETMALAVPMVQTVSPHRPAADEHVPLVNHGESA
jgi:hypothetical protein